MNRDVMVYVAKDEYEAYEGQRVAVFAFYHAHDGLCYDCVPVEDTYNYERLQVAQGWHEVGRGTLHELVGHPTRLSASWDTEWVVEWERTAPTPRNPYNLTWKLKSYRRRVEMTIKMARYGNWRMFLFCLFWLIGVRDGWEVRDE